MTKRQRAKNDVGTNAAGVLEERILFGSRRANGALKRRGERPLRKDKTAFYE